MGQPVPVLLVKVYEGMEYPVLKQSFFEYIEESYNKTFNDLKDQFFKSDNYHHCILKICYIDDKGYLKEYEDANNREKPLFIKESRFKPVKEKKEGKINKKSTIAIAILNDGICMCDKIIYEKCERIIKEQFQGRESQYKKEIEEIRKKRDEAIEYVKNLEEIQKQAAKKDNFIKELQEKIDFINHEKEVSEKETKLIFQELENIKRDKQENPKNPTSMKEFNVNKGIIENDILNKARNNINIYFDFNKSKESDRADMKNFQEIIEELLTKEKYESKLSKDILKWLKDKPLFVKNKKNTNAINHFNILVLGPSGVGKSTLINSMLLLDENKDGAKTSVGTACTKGKPKEYSSDKIEGIRLFDSQGIEMGDYNITKVKKDATELIESKIKGGDPDKYIHCIWYCVSETRFHTEEQDCLRELMFSYHQNIIPIIIVYGKAVDEQIKIQMLGEINKFIEQYKDHGLVVIPILAKEMANIKPFGTKKLLEITLEKLGSALESSCYEGMRKEKLKQFQEEFNRNLTIAEQEEEKKNAKEKKKKDENIDKEKEFAELFINKLSKIINIKFKENNLPRLSGYLLQKFRDINQEFENKMNDFVIIYADQLFTRYHNEFKTLDLKNGSNILKNFDTTFYDLAKTTIRSKLENEIKNKVLPETLKKIKENLLKNFRIMIDTNFDRIILENESILMELKTQVDKIVKSSYQDIHDKIDKCLKKYSASYSDEYSSQPKKENDKKEEGGKSHNLFLDGII